MNLSSITQLILDSKTEKEEIYAVMELSNFYEKILKELLLVDFKKKSKDVNGGVALSPEHAKECLKDYIRTARFIKGIYKATKKINEKFKNETVEIVYAGCGPLATLIVPILPFLDSKTTKITLIDIHEASILSVRKIIEYLNYDGIIKNYFLMDATKYVHPKNDSLHIVLTETMDKALINEPQVLITQNLVSQLSEGGVLVPEEIKLTSRHSFLAKEKEFGKKLEYESYTNDKKRRDLFSITKNFEKKEREFCFESDWIELVSDFENTPDICIYTEIKVFDDVYIKKGETLITNVHCVKSLYSIPMEANKYKLFYSVKDMPKWEIKNTQ